MLRRLALGVLASAALFPSSPARADAAPFGGCGGPSHSDCPPSGVSCQSCQLGESSCIDPLEPDGYTLDCQRGSVGYWCKPASASRAGSGFTMPLAGCLLAVSLWSSVRIGRRRPKRS
jgi:hypothetical protein